MSIFSAIGRTIFGGSGNSNSNTSSTVNSTTTSAPWAAVAPQLQSYIDGLGTTYGGGTPQISGYEQQGYDALQGAAGQASGANDAAIAENNKTLSGAYLTPDTNPYLADIASRVGGLAMAQANKTFGTSGRTGSGLHQDYVGQGVGNAITDLYGREYDAERGRMSTAVGMAPQLSASALAPSAALIDAGKSISSRPYDISSQYSSILGDLAGLGGTSTTQGTTTGTGKTTSQAESGGIVGNFINKLFK